MLRIQTLVEKLGKEYEPMIAQIKIAEFTKTIAQLSNISIENIPDEVIEDYLTLWAKNKFHFFKMLGNRVRVDLPFNYVEENRNTKDEMRELIQYYPAYTPWLREFSIFKTNKIDWEEAHWDWRDKIVEYLDEIVEGSTKRALSNMAITTFFKRYLNAEDSLVTKIGRIYENDAIDATFTISIDPTDMMLASETPYNWTSCYRLELMEDSHADGCLAAVLDDTSMITYVWNNKGKYTLYDKYEMKEIRYYRMREWIAVNKDFNVVHFNAIYPGKSNYSVDLEKKYRGMIENFIWKAKYPELENIWVKVPDGDIDREFDYGYDEYSIDKMWMLKGTTADHIKVYNERIICPCGCGDYVPGTSDDNDGLEYNGDGYICENFEEKYWCDSADDYCSDQDCEHCSIWNRDHAVCELDENKYCDNTYEAEEDGCFDPDWTRVVKCGEHCDGCPLYKLHHPEEENDDEEEEEEVDTSVQSDVDVEGFHNIANLLITIEYENKEKYYLSLNALTWQKIGESYGVFDPVTTTDVHSWCGIPVKIDDSEKNGHIILYKKLNVDLCFPSAIGSVAYRVKRMKL